MHGNSVGIFSGPDGAGNVMIYLKDFGSVPSHGYWPEVLYIGSKRKDI